LTQLIQISQSGFNQLSITFEKSSARVMKFGMEIAHYQRKENIFPDFSSKRYYQTNCLWL